MADTEHIGEHTVVADHRGINIIGAEAESPTDAEDESGAYIHISDTPLDDTRPAIYSSKLARS